MPQDIDADVIVLGTGTAGLIAAVAAHREGANVLCVEKAPKERAGGNGHYIGIIRCVSQFYSEEQFWDDLWNVTEGRIDPILGRILVNESAEAVKFMESCNVKLEPPAIVDDNVSGPTRRVGYNPIGRGSAMVNSLREYAEKSGIKILYSTAAVDLIVDDYGVVHGVKVKEKDSPTRELKSAAVVMACGGFEASAEMVVKYIDRYADTMVVRGTRYNTGDAFEWAQKVRARLDWMGDHHSACIHAGTPNYEGGATNLSPWRMTILVNKQGKRFIDEGETTEDKTYVKTGKAVFRQGGVAFVVFNQAMKDMGACGGLRTSDMPSLAEQYYQADTVEELAETIGIVPQVLRRTVDQYNAAIQDGKALSLDPPKTGYCYPMKEGPWYAYPATGGMTFTWGGFVITPDGEVVDKEERPIPGLFANGELTTHFFYFNYPAGSGAIRNLVFGRRAGRAAAKYALAHKGEISAHVKPAPFAMD